MYMLVNVYNHKITQDLHKVVFISSMVHFSSMMRSVIHLLRKLIQFENAFFFVLGVEHW